MITATLPELSAFPCSVLFWFNVGVDCVSFGTDAVDFVGSSTSCLVCGEIVASVLLAVADDMLLVTVVVVFSGVAVISLFGDVLIIVVADVALVWSGDTVVLLSVTADTTVSFLVTGVVLPVVDIISDVCVVGILVALGFSISVVVAVAVVVSVEATDSVLVPGPVVSVSLFISAVPVEGSTEVVVSCVLGGEVDFGDSEPGSLLAKIFALVWFSEVEFISVTGFISGVVTILLLAVGCSERLEVGVGVAFDVLSAGKLTGFESDTIVDPSNCSLSCVGVVAVELSP